jgi:hypothetical protein
MSLTELQRRTLANLSIPRNADDLATHLRPHATTPSADVDHLLRNGLSEHGWVVNLGQHANPATLAARVQRHKLAMDLPDEKAAIYSRRMLRPDLAWRMDGDLWMLTEEGLAQLHAVPDDAPPPLAPSAVQAAIDWEWARTYKDEQEHLADPDSGVMLGGAFAHPEHFAAWAVEVADDCEQRWNVRPMLPMAGGASGYSDVQENLFLDAENQKTTYTVAAPWFMALSILAFTDSDTGTIADDGTHKPTYTGYARASVAAADMPAASGTGGSVSNTTAITFAACTASTSTILAFANCSALTVGTLRKWGDCASTVISTTQTPATFAIGAYTTTLA